MSESSPNGKKQKHFDWREDLAASRDLNPGEIDAFGYVLSWIEGWRIKHELPPGRDAARQWWREATKGKNRPAWQLRQWEEAIRWYLSWLEFCQKSGGDARSIPERLKHAVHNVGARRGLALRTRQTYAGWVARFGSYAGSSQRVMDMAVARAWLTMLVEQ